MTVTCANDQFNEIIVSDKYKNFVSQEIIGQSFDGLPIILVKICHRFCGNKPAMWIDGGLCNKKTEYFYVLTNNIYSGFHGREWISVAAVMYMIDSLSENLPVADTSLVGKLDWQVILKH